MKCKLKIVILATVKDLLYLCNGILLVVIVMELALVRHGNYQTVLIQIERINFVNRMQAERQAIERNQSDKAATYVAELVGHNVWEVRRYPNSRKRELSDSELDAMFGHGSSG
jgi:hypothetical protein